MGSFSLLALWRKTIEFKNFRKYWKRGQAAEEFFSSSYWDKRYRQGGNSGAGSYGRLAEFKASVLNSFIESQNVNSVIEFGFGDGNQLSLSNYPSYTGFDISPCAISLCEERFLGDKTKRFFHSDRYKGEVADLVLSLDVIFHLVEDEVYDQYMTQLITATDRFLIIYSSDCKDEIDVEHVRHRKFSKWIDSNPKGITLRQTIKNPYPHDPTNEKDTSFCDFWIYQKQE